jgi:hypothetical protein
VYTQVFIILVALLVVGCGVKGDPLPPLKPNSIGKSKTPQEVEAEKRKKDGK